MADAAVRESNPHGHDSPVKENGLSREDTNPAEQLYRAITSGSTLSPELFERLYLSPQNRVAGELRKTFANPTPIAIMGFSVALTPLSIAFMGWRGAGDNGVATGTASLWFGGVLLIIAGFLEFILGNTFPFVVFMGYGAHFLTFATTFMPQFNAVGYFTGSTTAEAGFTPAFLAGYGFYPVSLCMLSFIFLICSLRTNLMFVLIFIGATCGFGCAAGAFFALAQGAMAVGTKLVVITGGFFFVAAMLGWYLFMSLMFAIMELPIPALPVFDLSTVIKAKKAKAA